MLNFPQELLHSIVDYFHHDSHTLASLRLVSRVWNFSATPLLFRELDLLISDSPPATLHAPNPSFNNHPPATRPKHTGLHTFNSLLSILDSSAHIPLCVRQLSLGRTSSFSSTDPESLKLQNAYARAISSIIPRLLHLSDVVFREMNWANLSPSFLSCILQTCKSPSLERIEIWNCQMPTTSSLVDFLGASRNVKSLRLSYFKILTADIDIEDTKLSPSSASTAEDRAVVLRSPSIAPAEPCTSLLHTLAIDAAPDAFMLHNLFGIRPSSINFLKLRRLYLGNVNDMAGLAEFLQKAGRSLDFLDIRLIPANQMQPRLSAIDLGLSHCPRLQHLRISGLHWTPSFCPSEYLSLLFSDQSLPIEYLQLMVIVIKPRVTSLVGSNCTHSQGDSDPPSSPPLLSRPTQLQYSDWAVLDATLSSRSFSSLKSLQISLKTIREREVDPSRLSDMFPILKERGIQVTCT